MNGDGKRKFLCNSIISPIRPLIPEYHVQIQSIVDTIQRSFRFVVMYRDVMYQHEKIISVYIFYLIQFLVAFPHYHHLSIVHVMESKAPLTLKNAFQNHFLFIIIYCNVINNTTFYMNTILKCSYDGPHLKSWCNYISE